MLEDLDNLQNTVALAVEKGQATSLDRPRTEYSDAKI
jgi:hypothetical protein